MRSVFAAIILCDSLPPLERWTPFISPLRIEKTKRIRTQHDKNMSVGAELAVHAALLSIGASYNLTDELYKYDHRGKPILTLTGKHISISHSGSMAVCAVSDIPIGADIEKPRQIRPSTVRAILSPDEAALYTSGNMTDQWLLEKWTVKESYLKLTGDGITGLSMTKFTADNGIILKDNKTEAYYQTIQFSDHERVLTCCAFEPFELSTRFFSSADLLTLLHA